MYLGNVLQENTPSITYHNIYIPTYVEDNAVVQIPKESDMEPIGNVIHKP